MTLAPDPNLPPVLELRSLKPYDRREVMDLWGRRVGVGIENTLDMVFDDDASVQGLAITEGESVVGFGVVMFLTPAGAEEYFSTSTDGYPIGETNAVFHAGVVDEDWEGRGLGSELMRLRLELVREMGGVDAAFGNAWLRPHTVDVSSCSRNTGSSASTPSRSRSGAKGTGVTVRTVRRSRVAVRARCTRRCSTATSDRQRAPRPRRGQIVSGMLPYHRPLR